MSEIRTSRDDLDFGRPGPVGRDHLTEAWNPGPLPVPGRIAVVLMVAAFVAFCSVGVTHWVLSNACR